MPIVIKVIGDCLDCGGKSCFGNVMIRDNILTRGCKFCRAVSHVQLPILTKKIVYLDQSLLSSAFKGKDARAVEVVSLIDRLSSDQLLVAPYSSIHSDETHQWSGYGGKKPQELMDFIKRTAQGVKFEAPYSVEDVQIVKGFEAYLNRSQASYVRELEDALSGDVHGWHDYVFITTGQYLGDVKLIGELKTRGVSLFVDAFDGWATSKTTFEEDIANEMANVGIILFKEYFLYMEGLATNDLNAFLKAPIISQVIRHLISVLPREMPTDQSFKTIREYFSSDHFYQLPYLWLSARIFATFRKLIKGGTFPNRAKAIKDLSGFFFDVQHIATYAPYSNAIFVDNQMAEVLGAPTVGLFKHFGCEVFSLNRIDEFKRWLLACESEKTESHRRAVARAYGGVP